MVLIDGTEKVRQRIANNLRKKLFDLPVEQPAIGDLILCLQAEQDGVTRRGFKRLPRGALFGTMHVLGYAESRR